MQPQIKKTHTRHSKIVQNSKLRETLQRCQREHFWFKLLDIPTSVSAMQRFTRLGIITTSIGIIRFQMSMYPNWASCHLKILNFKQISTGRTKNNFAKPLKHFFVIFCLNVCLELKLQKTLVCVWKTLDGRIRLVCFVLLAQCLNDWTLASVLAGTFEF